MVIGAPSHTHGPSFTRKPQPMSMNSPRTYLNEAVMATSARVEAEGAAVEALQVQFSTQVVDAPVINSDKFQ